jgi:hypothetical protein
MRLFPTDRCRVAIGCAAARRCGGGSEVPLNEDEQRILREIEQRFHAEDPDSARRIGSTTLPGYLARNCKRAAVGFVAGLVILLVAFASSWILGVFGFLIMVISAVVLIQNLHRMGRFGIQQIHSSSRRESLGEALDDAARRLRKRFGRPGE